MARTDKRVTAVIISDWKILLIHRFKNGREYWVFPGGGVEEGEDLDTALKREVMEETGLELQSYSYLFDQPADHGDTCIFYRCELQPGVPTLGGPELEEQSPNNQHLLEWVEVERLSGLILFPKQNLLVEILEGRDKLRKYKGYSGIVEYDSEGRIFTGEVIGLRPMITFQGRTPEEIEESFRRSIDLYLDMCAEDGVAPEKPQSGRVDFRIPPELHRVIVNWVAIERRSLNDWVKEALEKFVQKDFRSCRMPQDGTETIDDNVQIWKVP